MTPIWRIHAGTPRPMPGAQAARGTCGRASRSPSPAAPGGGPSPTRRPSPTGIRSVAAERRRRAGDPAGEEVVLGEPQLAVAELLREPRQTAGASRARARCRARARPASRRAPPIDVGREVLAHEPRRRCSRAATTIRPSRTRITSTPWFSHGLPSRVVAVSSQIAQPTSPSMISVLDAEVDVAQQPAGERHEAPHGGDAVERALAEERHLDVVGHQRDHPLAVAGQEGGVERVDHTPRVGLRVHARASSVCNRHADCERPTGRTGCRRCGTRASRAGSGPGTGSPRARRSAQSALDPGGDGGGRARARGSPRSAPACRGAAGVQHVVDRPLSMTLPRYMTTTRSRDLAHGREVVRDEQVGHAEVALQLGQQARAATRAATCRAPRSARRARRTPGRVAIARAMPTRCFWPPLSWSGVPLQQRRVEVHALHQLAQLRLRRLAPSPPCSLSGSRSVWRTVMLGFRLACGSWKTIWISRRSAPEAAARERGDVLLAEDGSGPPSGRSAARRSARSSTCRCRSRRRARASRRARRRTTRRRPRARRRRGEWKTLRRPSTRSSGALSLMVLLPFPSPRRTLDAAVGAQDRADSRWV